MHQGKREAIVWSHDQTISIGFKQKVPTVQWTNAYSCELDAMDYLQ